jgi:hypothetical protein
LPAEKVTPSREGVSLNGKEKHHQNVLQQLDRLHLQRIPLHVSAHVDPEMILLVRSLQSLSDLRIPARIELQKLLVRSNNPEATGARCDRVVRAVFTRLGTLN